MGQTLNGIGSYNGTVCAKLGINMADELRRLLELAFPAT
jgi:hypothetical protein